MSHKVKPLEKPEKQNKEQLKRNQSGSVGKIQSGRKQSLDNSIKGIKKSAPKPNINGKVQKQRQASVKKLDRSNSASHGLNKVKSDRNLRPKSDHRDKKDNKGKKDVRDARKIGEKDHKVNASQIAQRSLIKSMVQSKDNKNLKDPKQNAKDPKHPTQKNLPSNSAGNKQPQPALTEERDLGLTYLKPEFDKLILEPLDITDPVYEKYFDMISNDNDTYYVLNAIPEIKEYRKEEEKKAVEPAVMTGKMSKISGMFDQLTVEKIVNAVKNKPIYFENKVKVINMKLILFTKFKVSVDIGFIQYAVDHDKLVVLRLYLSKIYRKMNYLAFIMADALKQLGDKNQTLEKTCIFLHDRNLAIVKFFKYLGFKIERILTDSRSQKVDYFQEFVNKRKEFLAAYGKLGSS